MRRTFGALFIIVLAVVALGARPVAAVEHPVSGAFGGTDRFEFGSATDECDFVRVFIDAQGTLTTLGATAIAWEFCVALSGVFDIFGGTFTFTTPDGALTGTAAAGHIEPFSSYTATLTVTGGTGAFEGATGTLTVTGFLGSPTLGPGISAPTIGHVFGTIDVPLPTPTTKAACKNDGWRNFGDDNGVPFPNQGQCIRYVLHH